MHACRIAGLIAVVAAFALPGPVSAQRADLMAMERPIAAGRTAWIEEMTTLEVRDAIAAGVTTAIIATGGVEENGPYISTGKHNLILEGICPALVRELGNALCAPLVKFVPEGGIDPPTGAMRYPGTISVRLDTYVNLLDDIASSLRQAGFTDIVLIGDSGGNQEGMGIVAERLNERWQEAAARAHFIVDFYSPGWEDTERYTAEVLGVEESRHDGFHDDIWVTAMMAVSDPEQIRYQQRVAAGLASINGVDLEPLAKTVALGQAMIDFRAQHAAEAIREAIASGQ